MDFLDRLFLGISIIALAALTVISLYKIERIEERHKTEDEKSVYIATSIGEDAELLAMIFGVAEWDSAPMQSAVVTVTCYSSTKRQTDSTPYHVGDGSAVKVGIVAVSPDMFEKLGLKRYQRVLLIGYGVFEIRDTTKPGLEMTVDIWLPDEKAAWLHGRQTTVMLYKKRG